MWPCGFNNFSSDAKNSILFCMVVFEIIRLKLEFAYDAGIYHKRNSFQRNVLIILIHFEVTTETIAFYKFLCHCSACVLLTQLQAIHILEIDCDVFRRFQFVGVY